VIGTSAVAIRELTPISPSLAKEPERRYETADGFARDEVGKR
jgi:hypothetical protein